MDFSWFIVLFLIIFWLSGFYRDVLDAEQGDSGPYVFAVASAALFFDAGKVTSRREDLNLQHLRTDWGIGARFHGPALTALRIEIAHGSEGWNLVFASRAIF